jgi:hypothetical protein
MGLEIEWVCDWCREREPIEEKDINSRTTVWALKVSRPEDWVSMYDPEDSSKRIVICQECHLDLQQTKRELEASKKEAFKQLRESKQPRKPRLQQDRVMRENERKLKADGGFK